MRINMTGLKHSYKSNHFAPFSQVSYPPKAQREAFGVVRTHISQFAPKDLHACMNCIVAYNVELNSFVHIWVICSIRSCIYGIRYDRIECMYLSAYA